MAVLFIVSSFRIGFSANLNPCPSARLGGKRSKRLRGEPAARTKRGSWAEGASQRVRGQRPQPSLSSSDRHRMAEMHRGSHIGAGRRQRQPCRATSLSGSKVAVPILDGFMCESAVRFHPSPFTIPFVAGDYAPGPGRHGMSHHTFSAHDSASRYNPRRRLLRSRIVAPICPDNAPVGTDKESGMTAKSARHFRNRHDTTLPVACPDEAMQHDTQRADHRKDGLAMTRESASGKAAEPCLPISGHSIAWPLRRPGCKSMGLLPAERNRVLPPPVQHRHLSARAAVSLSLPP